MRHLNPEQLLDAAEGAADGVVLAHAATCERCAADVARLKTTLAAVSDVEVPEPSPLFWDHFSARVRDAVSDEQREPGTQQAAPRMSLFGRSWWLASAIGVAVVVIAAVLSWRADSPVVPPGIDTVAGVQAELLLDDTMTPAAPVEDASLDLLADLAADLDWDDATEAGLGVSAGTVDRVVMELSAVEREELRRLLTVEMAGKVL